MFTVWFFYWCIGSLKFVYYFKPNIFINVVIWMMDFFKVIDTAIFRLFSYLKSLLVDKGESLMLWYNLCQRKYACNLKETLKEWGIIYQLLIQKMWNKKHIIKKQYFWYFFKYFYMLDVITCNTSSRQYNNWIIKI